MTSIIDPIERGGSGGLSAWVGHLVDTVVSWPRAYRHAYRRAPRRTVLLTILVILILVYPLLNRFLLQPISRGFPRGGNGVLIMNVELRVPVVGDFGAAVFSDSGNVWERVTDFDITQLRGSVGFGVRYRSPIGPIRVDLGFKLDRRIGESRQVLHFSIGQAF